MAFVLFFLSLIVGIGVSFYNVGMGIIVTISIVGAFIINELENIVNELKKRNN